MGGVRPAPLGVSMIFIALYFILGLCVSGAAIAGLKSIGG